MTPTRMSSVPAGALDRESAEIGREVIAAFKRVVDRGRYVLGSEVESFELAFAKYLGVEHAVGVASGTDAITLAVAVLGIGPGDEVVMPAMTSVATAVGIINSGARPVLADVDPLSLNLDPLSAADAVTPLTRAIIPVHLYGSPAPMLELVKLANERGLAIIEDACQAHGATIGRQKAGTVGSMGCFSFYPSKNLGAYGDAGMIVTNNPEIAERLRLIRQYGWRHRDQSELRGWNSRLDEIQAAVLSVKLPYLDEWNRRRREIADQYQRGLDHVPGIELPPSDPSSCNHLFAIKTSARDQLQQHLARAGIATGVHYPLPIHGHPAFNHLFAGRSFPIAEAAAQTVISLPMFPHLTDREAELVIASVRSYGQ